MDGGTDALRRCVGDVSNFVDRHWGRIPFHRAAADESGFGDLLSIEDVDTLITSRALRIPQFRLLQDGGQIDVARYTKRPDPISKKQNSDQAHPGHILELFDAGATIVLQTLQDYWPPLTRFCRNLEFALTHPVQANAYITPRSAQGLAVHTDDHDVFVLQTFGRKNWKVYGPGAAGAAGKADQGGDPGELLIDVELKPGDMLYIPRGFAHSARTADVPSAHITIGIRAYQWRIVFEKALTEILDTLREPLPVGFADDPAELAAQAVQQLGHLKRRLDSIDLDSLSVAVTRHFWARRSPVLTGQLQQLIDLDDISDGSTLRRRPQSVCNLRLEEDRLLALLGDRELTMPARLEPALRRVLDGKPFRVSDLAEHLDGPGRLVFAQRLVREGLLENASEVSAAK
ncbi:cupin domain-containing protein [Streptomyces sp. NPDC059443]|uniref:cupin domain-containing protein n=1 Tax=unclassified Streptomyces TaxID=2593676 RepID=UPI003699A53B